MWLNLRKLFLGWVVFVFGEKGFLVFYKIGVFIMKFIGIKLFCGSNLFFSLFLIRENDFV